MASYSKVEYWDERYQKSENECSEWYQPYGSLRFLFNPESFAAPGRGNSVGRIHGGHSPQPFPCMETIPEQPTPAKPSSSSMPMFPHPQEARILILGCGNGSFGEDMRHDGWTGPLVNLDFSKVVIEQQKEKYHHFSPKMDFLCHDIREGLPFADGSFDMIVSKASFDAILCGPSPVGYARRLIQEIVRCLAPGSGIFFLVSSGNPDSRLVYLEGQGNELYHYWDNVRHHAVQRMEYQGMKHKTDYVYICRKRATNTKPPSYHHEPTKHAIEESVEEDEEETHAENQHTSGSEKELQQT